MRGAAATFLRPLVATAGHGRAVVGSFPMRVARSSLPLPGGGRLTSVLLAHKQAVNVLSQDVKHDAVDAVATRIWKCQWRAAKTHNYYLFLAVCEANGKTGLSVCFTDVTKKRSGSIHRCRTVLSLHIITMSRRPGQTNIQRTAASMLNRQQSQPRPNMAMGGGRPMGGHGPPHMQGGRGGYANIPIPPRASSLRVAQSKAMQQSKQARKNQNQPHTSSVEPNAVGPDGLPIAGSKMSINLAMGLATIRLAMIEQWIVETEEQEKEIDDLGGFKGMHSSIEQMLQRLDQLETSLATQATAGATSAAAAAASLGLSLQTTTAADSKTSPKLLESVNKLSQVVVNQKKTIDELTRNLATCMANLKELDESLSQRTAALECSQLQQETDLRTLREQWCVSEDAAEDEAEEAVDGDDAVNEDAEEAENGEEEEEEDGPDEEQLMEINAMLVQEFGDTMDDADGDAEIDLADFTLDSDLAATMVPPWKRGGAPTTEDAAPDMSHPFQESAEPSVVPEPSKRGRKKKEKVAAPS